MQLNNHQLLVLYPENFAVSFFFICIVRDNKIRCNFLLVNFFFGSSTFNLKGVQFLNPTILTYSCLKVFVHEFIIIFGGPFVLRN